MARSWTTDAPSPDDAAAQYAIQERLRMARALREQSMQGASLENVGGQLVGNPIARALTSGLQGFSAGRQEKRALGDASALAGQQRERLAAALAGAGEAKTPDDLMAYGQKLLTNPDPRVQEVGRFHVEMAQKAKEREATRQDKQYEQTNEDLRLMKKLTADQDLAKQKAEDAMELARYKAEHGGGDAPLPAADLQKIAYLRTLDPAPGDSPETIAAKKAKRDEFFQVLRAQQVLDRGGSQDVLQPGAPPGTVAASLPKTLPPDKTAKHAADVEREKNRVTLQPKAQAALAQYDAKTKQFDAAIERAVQKTNMLSAGGMAWTRGLPLTSAKELAAELREIQANIGFDALQEMRENSPTGGALGNVANYEIENLQATLGTLDQARRPEELIATLRRVQALRNDSARRMGHAYQQTWENNAPPPTAPPGAAGGLTPEEQAELDQLRQHFGKGAQP